MTKAQNLDFFSSPTYDPSLDSFNFQNKTQLCDLALHLKPSHSLITSMTFFQFPNSLSFFVEFTSLFLRLAVSLAQPPHPELPTLPQAISYLQGHCLRKAFAAQPEQGKIFLEYVSQLLALFY